MSERSIIIRGLILLVILILIGKLFSIQVSSDAYKLAAENNFKQRRVEYPYRGLIRDRNGELIVFNAPSYSLMIIPRDFNKADSVKLIALLGLDAG